MIGQREDGSDWLVLTSLADATSLASEWILFLVTDVNGKDYDWLLYSINTSVNPLKEHSGFGLHTGYYSRTNSPGSNWILWNTCTWI